MWLNGRKDQRSKKKKVLSLRKMNLSSRMMIWHYNSNLVSLIKLNSFFLIVCKSKKVYHGFKFNLGKLGKHSKMILFGSILTTFKVSNLFGASPWQIVQTTKLSFANCLSISVYIRYNNNKIYYYDTHTHTHTYSPLKMELGTHFFISWPWNTDLTATLNHKLIKLSHKSVILDWAS